LWLCYGAVHGPFTPADRHLDEYPGVDFDTPADIFPPRPGKPDWAQKVRYWTKGPGGQPMFRGKSLKEWVRQYHQGVLALDEGVERLLATLEATGQRDNTLIVFTSDQGLAWGHHGFRPIKIAAYDANIRSPLFVSFPGRVAEGAVCPTPVGGVDLAPTIFAFAGIDLPWEMHGHDLTPLLKNPRARWDHTMLLSETGFSFGSDTNVIPEGEEAFHNGIPWYVMVQDGRYKYVRPLVPDLEELYDLREDPEELVNLAVKPEHRETLERLRVMMEKELRRTGAGFVDGMPGVRSGM
jgi:arylsulfatase A-like enzyme